MNKHGLGKVCGRPQASPPNSSSPLPSTCVIDWGTADEECVTMARGELGSAAGASSGYTGLFPFSVRCMNHDTNSKNRETTASALARLLARETDRALDWTADTRIQPKSC